MSVLVLTSGMCIVPLSVPSKNLYQSADDEIEEDHQRSDVKGPARTGPDGTSPVGMTLLYLETRNIDDGTLVKELRMISIKSYSGNGPHPRMLCWNTPR